MDKLLKRRDTVDLPKPSPGPPLEMACLDA